MTQSLESNIEFGIQLAHYSDSILAIVNQLKQLNTHSDEHTNFFVKTLKT